MPPVQSARLPSTNRTVKGGAAGDFGEVVPTAQECGVTISREIICRFDFISLPAVEIPVRQLPASYPIRLSERDAVQVYRTPPNLYIYIGCVVYVGLLVCADVICVCVHKV